MKRTHATGSHSRYRVKGCTLQAARKRLEWTQEQVVRKLDKQDVFIEVRTYRRWEQGRSSMTYEQAQALCAIFQQKAQELGLREEHAEEASPERSFSLEIETQPLRERADALPVPDGQNGDDMVTFAQVLLPASCVVRIAVVPISREDLLDLLKQRRDEQPSRRVPLSSPDDGSPHQDLILALIGIADQSRGE
jgi:transcriptional regulator with XRE-family HTH domain